MNYAKRSLVLLTQVIVWLSLAQNIYGQAAPPKPLTEAEFTDLLQSRLKQVEDMGDLDAAAKTSIKELYQQALAEMQTAKRWGEMRAQNEKSAQEAPKMLEQVKAMLADPQTPAPIPPGVALPQIEQCISQSGAELEKLDTHWPTTRRS